MRIQPKLEEVEEERLERRATDIPQLIEKNIDAIPFMLTKNELNILAILLNEKEPVNTLAIRFRFEELRFGYIMGHVVYGQLKHIASDSEEPFVQDLRENEAKIMKVELKDIKKWAEERIKRIDAFCNTPIPSYEKIENDLLSLEVLSLVSKREDELKKSKYLWFIAPNFLTNWMKRRREILNEIKKEKIDAIELYGNKLLDFYLIQADRKKGIEFEIPFVREKFAHNNLHVWREAWKDEEERLGVKKIEEVALIERVIKSFKKRIM